MKLKFKQLLVVSMMMVPLPSLAFSLEEMACGAKICLSGDGGSPCKPFLDKYYSYEVKKLGKVLKSATERLRKQFLKKCKNKSGPAAVDLRK